MTAMCKSMGGMDAEAVYRQSFGALPHETTYNDPFGLKSSFQVNLREDFGKDFSVQMKAHTSQAGGTGTAGYAMVPIWVDPVIVDQTRKQCPATEIIPRVTNRGMYADYNIVTDKANGYTAAENASHAARDNTYDRQSTAIKFLYSVGAVTGQSIAAQPAYSIQGLQPMGGAQQGFTSAAAPNAKQTEILMHTRSIKELEENLIFNGNSTTSGITGNPNGTEFDGIVTLMSTTNTVAKGTALIELADITKAVRYAYDDGGFPNVAFCSTAVYEQIEKLLQAKLGYMQAEKQVFWGFNTIVMRTMVGDIPIVPSRFLSNTSGSAAIYFLDLSVVEMRVLQDLTYQELAITRDAQEFMLKMYETLIIKNTSFCASVTGVKT